MLKKDVIVIGAGLAGMVAALEARMKGADVVLISKGPLGIRSNSALSGARFAGSTPNYSQEEHVRDTLKAGKGINCEWMVRLMAREAPEAFSFLSSLGLDLAEFFMGYAVKPVVPDSIPGASLVRALSAKIRGRTGIDVQIGIHATEILKNDDGVYGMSGFDNEGKEILMIAPAIILAAGGAGAIYLRNDNQRSIMGQGYYLAAKAGLNLWDMEFVQFYPLVIAEAGLPSMPFFLPCHEETRLISAEGEDILSAFSTNDLNQATMKERDELSAFLFRESLRRPIYMDCRKVPLSFWEKNPWRRIKFDLTRKPLAISPAAHFFSGGVRIDERAQSSLPGLFACGEVVWGLHGANRMGGNAMTECIVFGRIAGRHAARYALAHPVSPWIPGNVKQGPRLGLSKGREDLKDLRKQLGEIAWRYAGVIRSQEGLKKGLTKTVEFEREMKGMNPRTVSEKKMKEELVSAAFVLKAVIKASSGRTERRGSFIREDFVRQDDLHWRKNSCLAYDVETGHFTVTYPRAL